MRIKRVNKAELMQRGYKEKTQKEIEKTRKREERLEKAEEKQIMFSVREMEKQYEKREAEKESIFEIIYNIVTKRLAEREREVKETRNRLEKIEENKVFLESNFVLVSACLYKIKLHNE